MKTLGKRIVFPPQMTQKSQLLGPLNSSLEEINPMKPSVRWIESMPGISHCCC